MSFSRSFAPFGRPVQRGFDPLAGNPFFFLLPKSATGEGDFVGTWWNLAHGSNAIEDFQARRGESRPVRRANEIVFDGQNDQLRAAIPTFRGRRTATLLWRGRRRATSGRDPVVVVATGNGNAQRFAFRFDGPQMVAHLGDLVSGTNLKLACADPADGKLHTWAAAADHGAGVSKLYLDGLLVAEQSYAPSQIGDAEPAGASLGAKYISQEHASADYAAVGLWPAAMTAREIERMHDWLVSL